MPLLLSKHAKDINILQWFSFGPPPIRAGEKIVVDIEVLLHDSTNLFLTARGIFLLVVSEFQFTAKFFECVLNCKHYETFLQYPVPDDRPLPSIVVPMLCL